ncbi:MAG TPA: extradiol ring-cleavage dioxygenase [Armatimonadota bacterium]|jgi:aromatic ring-opening dioxygenase LigB subunit
MPLCFACLAPHGWLTIPLLCGPEGSLAAATQAATRELGRRMAAARPDTIVLITPHGTMIEGAISLLNTPSVIGDIADLPWSEGSLHSFRLGFAVDRALNAAIAERSRALDVPVLRVANQMEFAPLSMDFASLIPLWYAGADLWPRPDVVIACPDRGAKAVSGEECVRFGRAVGAAAEASGRRVAFIASGDLGHAHDANHAYGYDPASAEFDALATECLRENALERLLSVDAAWLRRARTDAYLPLLALHGALEGSGWQTELLSYEVPLYFGMACASAGPPAP